jgi:hypothetical protein
MMASQRWHTNNQDVLETMGAYIDVLKVDAGAYRIMIESEGITENVQVVLGWFCDSGRFASGSGLDSQQGYRGGGGEWPVPQSIGDGANPHRMAIRI